jgi:2-dehydropantoate 2-reductase
MVVVCAGEDALRTFFDEALIMRILVVGAGAVGGFLGGRLAQAGRDVTFLARDKRAAEIQAHGLQIVSLQGSSTSRPKAITASHIAGPYDVVLLSVKGYALADAMNDFAAAVAPETSIIPVLNGRRHLELLAGRFGRRSVLGGARWVATELDAEGRIRQLSDVQKLSYGEPDGQMTKRAQMLDETFRGAGLETNLSSRIMSVMWEKWVQLASLGAVTCLLRGNIGEIVSIPGGTDIALLALNECASIADASGFRPSHEFLAEHSKNLTMPGSPLTSSMYRNLKADQAVEVENILGDLLEKGTGQGLTTPTLQAAFVNLSLYQRRWIEDSNRRRVHA